MSNEFPPSPAGAPTDVVESIKGFDSDLKCRGFQFAFGETYTVEGIVKACHNGFHACPVYEHPLSVLDYFPPAKSRFGIVHQSGSRDRDGAKLASASITPKLELTWHDIVTRTIKWVLDRTTPSDSKHSDGPQSASSATGDRSAALATGHGASATVDSENGVAIATGKGGKARGVRPGSVLFLIERDDEGGVAHHWSGKVGENGIEAGAFYSLRGGKPVKSTEDGAGRG